MAKHRDDVWKQQQQLEKAITDTYSTFPNMKIHEEDPLVEKVAKLALAIKESKNTVGKMKFEYEVHRSELQIRLQPNMPLEVQEQRQKDLEEALKGIFGTMSDCKKLLDDTM